MLISVINHTDGQIQDDEIQGTLRAINRQIRDDFEPYWSMGGELRLEGRSASKPDETTLADMRGEAVIYLWNTADVDDAMGYHEANYRGIPYGFVFTAVAKELGEPWSVTLSHEALEIIGDPEVNLLVKGPHPTKRHHVFHWYEMCDAVQAETYSIDGVAVSNFVLPLYFTGEEELGGRNDFLGRAHNGETLRSFGVNPGGYIGYYDPKTGKHSTYNHAKDTVATQRAKVKFALKEGRRGTRYQMEPASCGGGKRRPAGQATTHKKKRRGARRKK
jgi:hypothetical protein